MQTSSWGCCLSFAVLVAALAGPVSSQREVVRRPFPEACAAIEHLLVHFDHDCADDWIPAARDLVRALPAEVRITVAVRGATEVELIEHLLADEWSSRLAVLVVGSTPTSWARDRLLAIGGSPKGGLFLPDPGSVVEGYGGDLDTASALAEQLGKSCGDSGLAFEGGDIVCGGRRAFVGWHTIASNEGLGDRAEAVAAFEKLLGLEVVVVGEPDPPHDHLDMYLTLLDERTVVLGDPAAGGALLERLERLGRDPGLPAFDSWSVEAQRAFEPRYDTIRRQLERLGLRVLRTPILHGVQDGVLTWNNCLVERRGAERRVYMPVYGVPVLDDAAAEVYRAAGCRVLPITAAAIAARGARCAASPMSSGGA